MRCCILVSVMMRYHVGNPGHMALSYVVVGPICPGSGWKHLYLEQYRISVLTRPQWRRAGGGNSARKKGQGDVCEGAKPCGVGGREEGDRVELHGESSGSGHAQSA